MIFDLLVALYVCFLFYCVSTVFILAALQTVERAFLSRDHRAFCTVRTALQTATAVVSNQFLVGCGVRGGRDAVVIFDIVVA